MTKSRSPAIDPPRTTRARFANTGGIHSPALGEPSAFLDREGRIIWNTLKQELPWLTEADRCITELAVVLRQKVQKGGAHVTTIAQLRSVMKELGASPTSRKNVKSMPSDEGDEADIRFS